MTGAQRGADGRPAGRTVAGGGARGRIVGADGRAKAYRPLPAPRRRAAREAGISTFEEGRFWHAHELLEPAWMGSPDLAERDLDQGLIKLAAGYVHAERGNPRGVRSNLAGARGRLGAVITSHGPAGSRAARRAGVDVAQLLQLVEAALGAVERIEDGGGIEHVDLLGLLPAPRIPRLRRDR